MNQRSRGMKILSLVTGNLENVIFPEHPEQVVNEITVVSSNPGHEFQLPDLNYENLPNDDLLLQIADEKINELMTICNDPSILSANEPNEFPNLLNVQEPTCSTDIISTSSQEILNLENINQMQSNCEEQSDNPDDHTYIPDQFELNSDSEENETQDCTVAVTASNGGKNQMQCSNETPNGRTRKKRRHVNQAQWEKNSKKMKRQLGQKYYGKRKVEEKWDYMVTKKSKNMKDRCKCDGKTVMKCLEVSNDERTKLFEQFWQLSWSEKQVYLTTLVQKRQIKRARNRKIENQSRREFSYSYYLDIQTKQKVKVCKKMFCNTFSIPERTVGSWLHEKNKNNSQGIEEADKERNVNPRNTKINEQKEKLKEFFNSLPKLESHYCRKSTSKYYLEPMWTSKSELYRFYKSNWCSKSNSLPLSNASFSNMIDDLNLALFSPKKDECDKCVAHKTGNLSEEKYEEHQSKKEEARKEKEADKVAENCFVFTMDLQSVLLCPKSNVSSLYYKTKLVVHNFTLYNIKTKDGFCYLWHEGHAGLSANTFASILHSFFRNHVIQEKENFNKVILYSDGCTAQNRNALLSSALLNLSQELQITIEQKYLEKGHTQMECDSMHSTIERKLRKKIINVPADYVEVCQTARLKPKPYIVEYLDYTFFKNFQSMQVFNSIRPGRSTGDPTVTDIRGLRYNEDGSIMFKIRHSDEWKPLPCRFNKKNVVTYDQLPQMYNNPLPIKREKYQHLMELKMSLKKDYHGFYDNLDHS